MDAATIAVIASIVSVVSALSGIILGWKGNNRTERKDTAEEARAAALMQAKVDYIRDGVDELRLAMKEQNRKFDELAERVTRLEESVRNAHKRIDRLEAE